jgi:hypothetical protein
MGFTILKNSKGWCKPTLLLGKRAFRDQITHSNFG